MKWIYCYEKIEGLLPKTDLSNDDFEYKVAIVKDEMKKVAIEQGLADAPAPRKLQLAL